MEHVVVYLSIACPLTTYKNVTGWFTLGGMPTEHFVYTVHNIRDGGNYCVRNVTVTQIAEKGVCFTATCSFKRAESSPFRFQHKLDIKKEYGQFISKKDMFEHPDMPSQDSWWFNNVHLPQNPKHFNPLGGLHLRKLNMKAYNSVRAPVDRRRLMFYSARGSMPQIPESILKQKKPKYSREANLHAIAHIYASDRNSLFVIGDHLEISADAKRTATISHTVIFHVGVEELLMSNEPADRPRNAAPTEHVPDALDAPDPDSKGRKWYMQEVWTDRAEGGRGLHKSRIWDPETGVHLASTIQDGLVRFKDDSTPPKL
jgi:acyl-CoA thioesterase